MPTRTENTESRGEARLDRDQIVQHVKRIVAEQLGIDPTTVREDHLLEDDLGCDSLTMVEIVMEVEDHFGIDVPDETAQETRQVRDIVEGVVGLLR